MGALCFYSRFRGGHEYLSEELPGRIETRALTGAGILKNRKLFAGIGVLLSNRLTAGFV
jgi:hypothetical protein